MKKLLCIALICLSQPVFAQEAQTMTPLQQYLYSESGYAPPSAPQPAPVAQPYTTASVPSDPYEDVGYDTQASRRTTTSAPSPD